MGKPAGLFGRIGGAINYFRHGSVRPRRAAPAKAEKRSTSLKEHTEARWAEVFGHVTASGAAVNENSAVTVATVMACVGILADMVAKLPCKLYRKAGARRWEDVKHPAHDLVSLSPGSDRTAFELRELMQVGIGLGGNGYARVIRNSYYEPVELQWLRPCDVQPWRTKSGVALYEVNGLGSGLTRADILHVRWKSMDGISGMSPVRLLRESIGLAMAQRTETASIAANGAKFPGFMVSPANQTPQQMKDNREEWRKNYTGSANAGTIPFLWGGFDFKAVQGMSLQDAEFLESRKFERSEIEMAYRVPPVLIGDNEKTTSWGTGIEQLNLGFLNYCLDPYLVNWEQSLNFTLLTAEELRTGSYFKFTREALLAVAKDAQAVWFEKMRNIGVYDVDDIRDILDLNPLPIGEGGDDYSKPFNGAGGAAKAEDPAAGAAPNGKKNGTMPDALKARMLQ